MTEKYPRGISVTLKGHTGYDAPWIVLHGYDAEDVAAMLTEVERHGLYEAVSDAHRAFRGLDLVADRPDGRSVTPPLSGQGGQQQPVRSSVGATGQGGADRGSDGLPTAPPPGTVRPTCPEHGEPARFVARWKRDRSDFFMAWTCPRGQWQTCKSQYINAG